MSDTETEKKSGASENTQEEATKESSSTDVAQTAEESSIVAAKDNKEDAGDGDDSVKATKNKKSTGRTPKGVKAAPKAEDDAVEEYAPGDSVQVKIQGYPWWPAIVVTPEHFPAAALAARPQVKTRKDGTSALTYPVQFLGSPEYYWSRPTDIKRLPIEEIKAFNDSGKKSSTKGLKAAYQHAAMEPSLEQLMKAKTELEAQQARQDESGDEEMPDDEEDEDAGEDSEEVELDDEGKPIKKKAKKSASSKTPRKTPQKTPSKKRKTEETDGQPSIKKARGTPKSTPKARDQSPELTPEAARKKAYEAKVRSVMFWRHKLQKCLLGKDEPDPKLLDEIPGYLEKLDSVEANVDLFRETKIGKVLLRINKLEKIPRDETLGIKSHVTKLLEKWQEVMDLQKKRDDEDATKETKSAPETSNGHTAEDEEQKDAPAAATTNGDAGKAAE